MIRNWITKIIYSWKTSPPLKVVSFIFLFYVFTIIAQQLFRWSNIIQFTLMLMLLIAMLLIFWLFKNDKLSTRVNHNTILMRYKNYIYIHIYSSPKDKRSCSTKRRSLASDARTVVRNLPEGKYATVSHGIILSRLKKAQRGRIISNLSAELVYKSSNKRNISKLYGCRACKDKWKCSIYDESKKKIDFYYIEFTKP